MRALPTWKQPYRDGEEDPKAPPRPAFMHRPSVQMGEKSLQDEVATRARLKHILKSLSGVIFGIDLLAVLLVSSIVTLLVNSMSSGNVWLSFLLESKAAISTLGAFYSFALVFRTNICYSRWWEGRTLWGSIIIYTIRITQQGQVSYLGKIRTQCVLEKDQSTYYMVLILVALILVIHSSGLRTKHYLLA